MSRRSVAVVIPYRPEPGREPLVAAVRRRLREILPDAPQILADSGHERFSRAASRNLGVRRAEEQGADVVVICDADTIVQPDPLRHAIQAAQDGRMHWPYTRYLMLSRKDSSAWLAGGHNHEGHRGSHVRGAVGGVLVCTPQTWNTLAGQDERFTGWGMEDTAFAHVAAALVGTARHEGYVLHLWHPDTRGIGGPQWKANAKLCEEYLQAGRDRLRDMIGARMAISSYLTGLVDGNYHRGGIRALQVGVADRLDEILADCEKLIADYPSSVVKVGHITGWTKPIGEVRQWSLWNSHGQTDNTSEDFALSKPGRSVPAGLSALADFAASLPSLGNLRLNMLGPGGALSPHEEHLPIPLEGGKVGLRARFHLPVITNQQATLDADGRRFHFELGKVYAFNNGCVHSARNASDAPRFHLVWDQLMTKAAHDAMFRHGTAWVRHARAEVPVLEEFQVGGYERQPGMSADEFAKRRLVYMPA